MCVYFLLLTLAVSLVAGDPQGGRQIQQGQQGGAQPQFDCIEDGFFQDNQQCDLYWQCSRGRAIPHLCEDGLVFDVYKARAGHVDPCDTPLVVDCTDRPLMQKPTRPNPYCTRRHGIFPDPDETVCNRFHTCKDGIKQSSTDCSPGLHFDIQSAVCTWPDTAGRQNCVEKSTSCLDNNKFCCQGEQVFTADGMIVPHPSYVNLDDCQKFYVCLNGKVPQESSCTLGQVFNEHTSVCDYPENVPECRDFYANHPLFDVLYDDANADGVRDFADRRDFSQTSIN